MKNSNRKTQNRRGTEGIQLKLDFSNVQPRNSFSKRLKIKLKDLSKEIAKEVVKEVVKLLIKEFITRIIS